MYTHTHTHTLHSPPFYKGNKTTCFVYLLNTIPSSLSQYLDKKQTNMSINNHELQSTLQALGYYEDGKYYKTKDCLNAAKDLLRYLRRDDENNERSIRIELLKSDIISNDLIQIIKSLNSIQKDDNLLFELVLRLLVNLTQSSPICHDFKMPNDKIENDIYMKIDLYLKNHKEAFADVKLLKCLCSKLKVSLDKNWKERNEDDENMIERILLLIRNILSIKFDVDTASKNLNSHDK
jgi:timeless